MNYCWASDTTLPINGLWSFGDAHEISLTTYACTPRTLLTIVQILEHARDEYLFMSVHCPILLCLLMMVRQQLLSLCS